MISLAAQIVGVDSAVEEMSDHLNSQMEHALRLIGESVAGDAKTTHSFRNRTGRLEASIVSEEPRGTFLNDTLSVNVKGKTPYAIFVEERWPTTRAWIGGQWTTAGRWTYLVPAIGHQEDHAYDTLDQRIGYALRAAGWGE